MSNKTLRGSVTILAAEEDAFVDPSAPTADELNDDTKVHDISCAIEDSYTLNASESATDDSMSVCDVATVENPTFPNYEASLDSFIDEDEDATGVYNLARDLFEIKGKVYYLVKRLNVKQGSTFTAGQIIYVYRVITDNQQLIVERGSAAMYGNRFKPDGEVYTDIEVAA